MKALITVAEGAISATFLLVGILMFLKPSKSFDAFIKGAKDGMKSAVNLLPTLVLVIVAVNMVRASGLADLVSDLFRPIVSKVGVPSELVPFIVLRPLSGGASIAMLEDLFSKYTPDSFVSRCAAVIMSSSDTIFYICAVYFGVTRVKKQRYAVFVALTAMLFSVFITVFFTRLFMR